MKQIFDLKKRSKQLISGLSLYKIKNQKKEISFEKIGGDLNQNTSLIEKFSLHSLQRHLSLLKLEQFLIIISLITAGVLGRILLQGFPSIEPITLIAVLTGSLFGIRKGAIVGASSWYLSNFFMFGGQGPWTIIHIASGILAGGLGGLFLFKKPTYMKTLAVMIVSTLFFEISMNIMSGLFFFGIIASFITAIPFTITHLVSNTAFSFLLPKARKTVLEKGKLNEKEICEKLIKKLKQKRVNKKNV